MGKKNRIISALCMVMLAGTIFFTSSSQTKASAEETKLVDGSYLTMNDSASSSSQDSMPLGEYLLVGECSITKAGKGKIYVYGGTTAAETVNFVSTIVYVDQYSEEDNAWYQVDAWSKDAENTYFVSTSKTLKVDSGYYYRVHADHFAGMQYPYDEATSFTDGILID